MSHCDRFYVKRCYCSVREGRYRKIYINIKENLKWKKRNKRGRDGESKQERKEGT